MISIQRRFLFIHVPKTGGNSIQNILKDYSEDDIVVLARHQDGTERFEVRNRQYKITKHSTLSHYRSVLDADTYRSLFKFAVIRNPWDRMISFYFSPHREIKVWNRNDFLALVKTVAPFRRFVTANEKQPILGKVSGKLGMRRINNIKKPDADVDFIMRFERLDEDFKVVCRKIGIQDISLPKRNASVRAHYSKYYDEELVKIVQAKFEDEIEYGNYKFENHLQISCSGKHE